MSSDMKILTVNFLTCAVKGCKASPLSFPLHFQDAELEQSDIEYSPSFLSNVLPRIDWEALKITANEVCTLCNLLMSTCLSPKNYNTFTHYHRYFMIMTSIVIPFCLLLKLA